MPNQFSLKIIQFLKSFILLQMKPDFFEIYDRSIFSEQREVNEGEWFSSNERTLMSKQVLLTGKENSPQYDHVIFLVDFPC